MLTVVSRVAYLEYPRVDFNADEATTGIMVQRILAGHNYIYYAGQNYGGTAEQYAQAVMYLITPLPQDRLTLRFAQVALSVLTCLLIYRCAILMFGEERMAILAAALFAVSPWFNVVSTATSQGFYVASQVFVTGALYCALRFCQAPSPTNRWIVLAGFLSGLAAWTAVTTLYVILPLAIWSAPAIGRHVRAWGRAVAAALAGASPALVYAVAHHRSPLPKVIGPHTTVIERLQNLSGPIVREFLGLTYQRAEGGLPVLLQGAIVWAFVLAYAVAIYRRRLGLLQLLSFKTANRRSADIFLLIPPFVLLLFAASPGSWYTDTPRYLISAFPVLCLSLAAMTPSQGLIQARTFGTAVLAASCALSLGFFMTSEMYPLIPRREQAMRAVTALLESDHEARVYVEYWTAMPLQYLAGRRLTVAVCLGSARFPASQREVARARHPVYVTSTANSSDVQLRKALVGHHISFRERSVDYLRVYDQLPDDASPSSIGI
ncbi:MAG: ArnT family glycosyltransferase [Jatrophihabitans sp.]